MDASQPMFLLREARPPTIAVCCNWPGSWIRQPADESAAMAEALKCSANSFRGRLPTARARYMFCAEEIATDDRRRLDDYRQARHAASPSLLPANRQRRALFTHLAQDVPPYLPAPAPFDGRADRSGRADRGAAMRRAPEKVGKQLSWVRFLYMATPSPPLRKPDHRRDDAAA